MGDVKIEQRRFEIVHQALTEHFFGPEISDIAAIVINMNVWTHLKRMAFGF